MLIFVAYMPLSGTPWWCTLLFAAILVLPLEQARMEWALIDHSTPLLPLLDAIEPYTDNMVCGHTRVFEHFGADTIVICTRGLSPFRRTFRRVNRDDLEDIFDSGPGERVHAISHEIMINGPIVIQRTVVDSSDPHDPLTTRIPSRFRQLAIERTNAKTGFLHPTTADMRALLEYLRTCDLTEDICPATDGLS
ncbi:hypothetical protein AB0942_32190 [Streptomyces nodosus]|uniref:hypothetical protein n=1 Tax=Streptomyces nodosus TaxID=40318 RepID=UPI00345423AA